MNKPLVYIVILNWNGGSDTVDCLESVEFLAYDSYKVVVVDNGSTDDSAKLIRESFPQTALIETTVNLGFSGGVNVGVRFALENGADYVWLLNNDTIIFPDTLVEMVNIAEGDQNIGAVGSVLYEMNAPKQIQAWGGGHIRFLFGYSVHARLPATLDYLTAASLLVHRLVLYKVGFLDDRYFLYWEDVDFSFRIRAMGYSLAVADKSRVLHKESASLLNHHSLRDSYDVESMIRFFMDYSPAPFFTITVGLLGKATKRLLLFQFTRIHSIFTGIRRAITL